MKLWDIVSTVAFAALVVAGSAKEANNQAENTNV